MDIQHAKRLNIAAEQRAPGSRLSTDRRVDQPAPREGRNHISADADPAAVRVAAIVLLALASVSFATPTIVGLGLVVAPERVSWLVPLFYNVEDGPWAFVQEYWTAIPALAAGVFVARRGSRRTATFTVLGLTLFVVLCGSMALHLQPSDQALRAIASELPGATTQHYSALLEVWVQIERTRAIAIPFFTALAGAAAVTRRSQ